VETDQAGNWTKEYVYMGGQHVAEFSGGQTFLIHRDHLGSVRTITSYQGYVAYDNDYLPSGEQILGGNWETHQFAGYERDYESTLDYANARFYSSSIARFMSADSAPSDATNPQSFNRYAYVGNNPLNATDPSGLVSVSACFSDCGGGFGFGFSFGFGFGWGGRNWDWGGGPTDYSKTPANVGENPNPPNGTLTSDDPFGGETNGIPNGLQVPTLGFPGNPGCEFGGCVGVGNGFAGSIALEIGAGAICPGSGVCEAIITGGLIVGTVAELAYLLRPIFQSRKQPGKPANAPTPPANPSDPPGPGWEWRGSGPPGSSEGSWYNPSTGESLHPDLGHGDPIGPHWDYTDPTGKTWRIP
jgi:RHS repeat-associated protein